nr:hypothetical protein [Micromonospora sp. DSM 115978]
VELDSGLVVPVGAADGISVKADVDGVSAMPPDAAAGVNGTVVKAIDPTIRLDALGDTGALANLRSVDAEAPPPVSANLAKIDVQGAVLLEPGKITNLATETQLPAPVPVSTPAVLPDSVAARVDTTVPTSLTAPPPTALLGAPPLGAPSIGSPSLGAMPPVAPLTVGALGD